VQKVSPHTLGVLHNQVLTLMKLVEDLNDLSKADQGQLRYQFVPVDVAALLHETMESFAERLASKSLRLETNGLDDLPCIVEADSTRLKQLFSNLLENSVRYTNEGGTIRVSATQQTDTLLIKFDDSEPGVRPQFQEKIFDRFYRTESSRNRLSGGAGLGLSICRAIVESHHGKINAAESPLGGLQILIELPKKG